MSQVTGYVNPEVVEICRPFEMPTGLLCELRRRFLYAIRQGLSKASHSTAPVKCFNTFVQDLPTKKEVGKFYALDLGGTNFRVLLITLDKDNFQMKSKIFAIPEHIFTGSGEQLFDHIADCLIEFRKEHHLSSTPCPLGFTFSFPCVQKGLNKGILVQWTKGFNASGVVGKDVVQLLLEALKRKGDNTIDVCAILNDTTGTLMSLAWNDPFTKIGLIVGTGCNACYIEKIENVELFEGDPSKPYVIINTEWGNFGADGALNDIRTKYDRDIDEHSPNPGQQLFEKMLSGMYLGELVRQILVDLVEKKVIFNGKSSKKLLTRGAFTSRFLSEVETEKDKHQSCCKVLEELGLKCNEQDCCNLHYVCQSVTSRSAKLVSMGLSALIEKMGYCKMTIGVDGSVYRFHPTFHSIMMETIRKLTKPEFEFDIKLSVDGSGRGAALVAAAACRQQGKKIPTK